MDEIEALKQQNAELLGRIGRLEDITDIRRLQFAYGYYIDYCHYGDVLNLFAEDAEVVFLSGVYKGRASIKRLDYMLQWQAEYEHGWAHTDAHLRPAQVLFPEDPHGPDYLLDVKRETWPYRQDTPVHYAHPVLAKMVLSGKR